MKKKIFILISQLFLVSSLWAAAQFKSGTQPLVDGIYNSDHVVITGRDAVFSWTNGSAVSSFTVVVSSDNIFQSSGEIWNFVSATTAANTINFITRIKFNEDSSAAVLSLNTTYYWQVTVYEDGTSDSALGQFYTVSAGVSLELEKLDLQVDWNNPFTPPAQYTKFRFTAKDRDRKVKLRVFSISGELIRDWPEQTILQNAWYEETWDGKNYEGEIVARGMYFVNIADVGESKGVTRRVAVEK